MTDTQHLSGVIESFRGPYGDSFYILSVSTPTPETVTGNFVNPGVGDCYRFTGKWSVHSKYGKQFLAKSAEMELPKGSRGVRLYMENNFPWVGPKLAGRLHDRFGDRLFDVIEKEPDRLIEVRGISVARANEISAAFKKIKRSKETDMFFSTHGVTSKALSLLVDRYGSPEAVVEKVKENPYRLIDDVKGIGWKKADALANSLNISRTSPFRLRSGIIHVLSEATLSGHCYLPEEDLLAAARKLLEVDSETVEKELRYLADNDKVVGVETASGKGYYTKEMFAAERNVAMRLRRMVG